MGGSTREIGGVGRVFSAGVLGARSSPIAGRARIQALIFQRGIKRCNTVGVLTALLRAELRLQEGHALFRAG